MDLLSLTQTIQLAESYKLPEPDASWTVPIAIGLGVIALLLLVKKLVMLAVVLALLAAGFIAYQSGAFDTWVDQRTGADFYRDIG